MDATLKLTANTLAYADLGETSDPSRRYVDWSVSRSYPVQNPKVEPYTIDPGATVSLFNGLRTTALDNSTAFALTLSTLSSTRYRFTWTGAGHDPGLRSDRAIDLSTKTVTLTANANLTLTFASGSGDFTGVQVGDTLFIPSASTGDAASPFNVINGGYWNVMSVDGTFATLQLSRLPGASFAGMSEVVTVASAGQVLIYSSAGVQAGDKATLSAGFPLSVLNTYQVVAVTSKWFEVIATQPLPVGITAVPTVAGLQFYSNAKRYIRVEIDQECVLRLNGDSGNTNRLSPWSPGDPDNTGGQEKTGPTWSASIVNLSTVPLNLLFISAE